MANKLKANHWQVVAIITLSSLLLGAKGVDALHDPTEPPAAFMPAKASEISYKALNLTATFIKPTGQWAIINSKTYYEGDAIGEYIITNIDIDAVELIDSANNKEILKLAPPVKRAVPIKEEQG